MNRERALQERVRRMVYARETAISQIRQAVGGHLPRPAISAIYVLCDALMDLQELDDEELEVTTTGRAPS